MLPVVATYIHSGTAKVLCINSPVQDIIIRNIPGALGTEVSCNHDDSTESVSDLEPVNGEVTMSCDRSNSVTGDHRVPDSGSDPAYGMTFSLSHKRSHRNPVWNESTTDTNEVE